MVWGQLGSHFTEGWDDAECVGEAIPAHLRSSAQNQPLTSYSGDLGIKEMLDYIYYYHPIYRRRCVGQIQGY